MVCIVPGILIDSIDVPLNAPCPIVFNPYFRSTDFKFLQFSNALSPIVSNVLGNAISSSVSLLKYFDVTSVIPSPKVTFFRFAHSAKTPSHMVCTVPGIVIDSINVPLNAPLPIVFNPSFRSTDFKFLQFSNALSSIVSNVLGSIISSKDFSLK